MQLDCWSKSRQEMTNPSSIPATITANSIPAEELKLLNLE